jgi:hypothetical protein
VWDGENRFARQGMLGRFNFNLFGTEWDGCVRVGCLRLIDTLLETLMSDYIYLGERSVPSSYLRHV